MTATDVMGETIVTRTLGDYVLRFAWCGGAYIDIRVHGRAVEVINVWDCVADRPGIPRAREALSNKVDEWLAENGDAFLHDLVWGNYG